MIVGNAHDAETILRFSEERKKRTLQRVKIPNGWKTVGIGASRTAYLSPDEVIYKVQKDYVYSRNSNYGEFDNIVRILRSGRSIQGVRLPKSTLYELSGKPVMAMEYVNGIFPDSAACFYGCYCQCFSGECNTRTIEEIRKEFCLRDLNDRNVMFVREKGEWVVIDLEY